MKIVLVHDKHLNFGEFAKSARMSGYERYGHAYAIGIHDGKMFHYSFLQRHIRRKI